MRRRNREIKSNPRQGRRAARRTKEGPRGMRAENTAREEFESADGGSEGRLPIIYAHVHKDAAILADGANQCKQPNIASDISFPGLSSTAKTRGSQRRRAAPARVCRLVKWKSRCRSFAIFRNSSGNSFEPGCRGERLGGAPVFLPGPGESAS